MNCPALRYLFCFFLSTAPAPAATSTLSLHDALPICSAPDIAGQDRADPTATVLSVALMLDHLGHPDAASRVRDAASGDRKSTRLNSSHVAISYAVFCLKKKKQTQRACRSHADTSKR